MEQHLKLLGIVLFGVTVFLNLRIMQNARLQLTGEQLVALQRASDPKIWTFLAAGAPLLLVLWLVETFPEHAVPMFATAIVLTFLAVIATGILYLRRARAVGMPEAYLASYRKAHVILSTGFLIAIVAVSYPVISITHAG